MFLVIHRNMRLCQYMQPSCESQRHKLAMKHGERGGVGAFSSDKCKNTTSFIAILDSLKVVCVSLASSKHEDVALGCLLVEVETLKRPGTRSSLCRTTILLVKGSFKDWTCFFLLFCIGLF